METSKRPFATRSRATTSNRAPARETSARSVLGPSYFGEPGPPEAVGVDAVLNSLAGEFIPKSLAVLAPFGRFLEIGKVDVYGNSKVGLAAFKNNIS